MNATKKNILPTLALIIGILLLIATGIFLTIKLRKDAKKTSQSRIKNKNFQSTQPDTKTEIEQIKRMQRYLLNLGVKYNNNFIIDAINLTGGIDGKIGSGFRSALSEAIEKGYVKNFNDLQNLS